MPRHSDVPLPERLGLTLGGRLLIGGEVPEGFLDTLAPLPEGTKCLRWPADHATGPADHILFFARTRASLVLELVQLSAAITPKGAIWVAWPKKFARTANELTEDMVREIAVPIGVMDTKVCSLNDQWVGMRLAWRKENRPR